MNTENTLNNKKIILDNFNKGKYEKVIKLGKKFLKKIMISKYYMH